MSIKNLFTVLILITANILYSQTTVTFNYTGSAQTWVVPPCVTSITVTAAGADGGGANGGNGAIVTGTLAVTPGQTLQMNVGGSGACPGAGFNGGGVGKNASSAANASCGGGGASDIRISPYALANRLIVASGGGGMGGGTSDAAGGAGGCATGNPGTSPFGQGGGGASQTAGGTAGPPWISSGSAGTAGTLGNGGSGGSDPCYNVAPGGGGGGGYYGGGGGGSDCFSSAPYGGGSGGGGSSLIPGGGGCTAGTNNGPGYITITYTLGAGAATATNTGPYCIGATIQLNGTGGTTFSWTGPNGFTSSLQNPTIPNATAANGGTYNLTVTGTGCTATASTTVVMKPLPAVNAGADQSICQGAAAILSASGATTYSWNNGVTNNVAFIQPVGTVTYTVTGTTAGCTNTDQVVVTVNPNPTVVANDVSVCSGGTVAVTATGASTYMWTPATGLSATSGSTVNSTPSANTTYTVIGTSAAGCVGADLVTVSILPNAVINAGSDVTICQNTNVTLTATGGTTYSWDNGLGNGNNFSVSPSSTTTYTVIGTDANGCTGTDAMNITVNPLPAVNAGLDQTICSGFSVVLSGSGASTYTWDNGVTDGISFTPGTGTITYTVTGTSVSGCISTDQVDVIVNALPAINAGPDQSVCDGTSVTLNGSGGNTYTWDNGVTDAISFTPTTSATYTVTGTDLNGCINTDNMIVTVFVLPIVGAGTDVVVCDGTNVTLNGSGASTYTWDNSITDNFPFTPAVGTLTYTVMGTSVDGCIGTDQVDVTVNANPTPTINGATQYCAGTSSLLNADQVYAAYNWSTGASSASINAVQANNPITVTVTDNNGCQATSPVYTVNAIPLITTSASITICQGQSAVIHGVTETLAGVYSQTFTAVSTGCDSTSNVTLVVNALPNVNAGIDQSVCIGTSTILTGSGAASYTWDNGVTNGVAFNQAVGSVTYTVTGTSAAGCIKTDQVTILVNPLPTVNFTPDVTIGCTPLTVNFTNNDPTSSSCQWVMSDGTILNGCGTVTNTFEQIGCYDIALTITSSAGCVNTLTASNLVCVEGPPDAAFIPSASTLSEYNTIVHFINSTAGGDSYSWDFGDNTPTSTDIDPTHDYHDQPIGNYTVTLIAYSPIGCSDTTTSIIQIQEDLIYYIPNTFTPDGDMFNQTFQPVFTSGFDPYDFNLFIYDRWGEIIFESHNAAIGWDGSYGGRLVPEGVYTWKIDFKTSSTDERKMIVGHVNVLK